MSSLGEKLRGYLPVSGVLAWVAAVAVALILGLAFEHYSLSNWPGSPHRGTDEAFGSLGAAAGFWLAAAVVRGVGKRAKALPSLIELIVAPVVFYLFYLWTGYGARETSFDGEPFVSAGAQMRVVMVAALVTRVALALSFALRVLARPAVVAPSTDREQGDRVVGAESEERAGGALGTGLRSLAGASLSLALVTILAVAGAELGNAWATRLWHPALIGHSCPRRIIAAACAFHAQLASGFAWAVLGGLIGVWLGVVGARLVAGRGGRFGVGERTVAIVVTGLVAFWAFFFGSQQGGTLTDLRVFLVPAGAVWLLRIVLSFVPPRRERTRVDANRPSPITAPRPA